MDIIVQKFGGTSVTTKERRKLVVEKIKHSLNNNLIPVVVVSAMGRKGDPYATDTLLSMINEGFKTNNPKAMDFLMSCGEMISTVVLCNDLYDAGIRAMPLTGGQAGIITDAKFNNASVKEVNTSMLMELISQGIVPVVSGFQGATEKGEITTLGRGGSDTTASILGVALKAKEIDIFTDVDGIMTADPRIVQEAEVISKMNYLEVFQYADQGAKVIHPRAVDIAKKGSIPLKIKNTFNESDGTIIDSTDEESKKIIAGITYTQDRIQVVIKKANNEGNPMYKNLLNLLAKENISIDLINVFPEEKIFTISSKDKDSLCRVLGMEGIKYSLVEGCSNVALIGTGMRGIPGVMASIVEALNEEEIEILQSADSFMTIWCLVKTENVKRAINILHKKFM
ncbi:aspartate kinase [Alloiococcus sp. CFN-8]|uniref:aspartate kinase n=1 Tax=Alloiococcus sp. CFN-8 TaxID=3416081 RepID=UPI003CEC6ADE